MRSRFVFTTAVLVCLALAFAPVMAADRSTSRSGDRTKPMTRGADAIDMTIEEQVRHIAHEGRIAEQSSTAKAAGLLSAATQQGGDVAGSCLNALSGYLAASSADSGVSLAAQSLSRDDRVRLEGRDGTWQVDLALDTERSWAELLYQLQKNFNTDYQTLTDQDRSRGEFMVDYIPREERDGGWLGIGGDGDPVPMVLKLRAENDHTLVTATRADGEETTPALARELLDAVASTLR